MNRPADPHCHPLHDPSSQWPLANCSLDLWIEYLHRRGLAPEAAMGALVRLDDEGDQFTFCKFDHADIFRMFGLDVQELALFDKLDHHIATQTARGNLVMIELDGFHLPDTQATAYQRTHGKTMIGIDLIDPATKNLRYLHNAGQYDLGPNDYDALLGLDAAGQDGDRLFPFTEFVKPVGHALPLAALRAAAIEALRQHLTRAPARNPFASYQARFPADLAMLGQRPLDDFHLYAFNHFRQFGAVFAYLAAFARWLAAPDTQVLAASCTQLAESARRLQFHAARACARQRADPCEAIFADLVRHWDIAFGWLRAHYG